MKTRAVESPSRDHVRCPFCGFPCLRQAKYRWCSACDCEYISSRTGEITFDTDRRVDHDAWAEEAGAEFDFQPDPRYPRTL